MSNNGGKRPGAGRPRKPIAERALRPDGKIALLFTPEEARRILIVSDDLRAALPFIERAREMCFSKQAQHGLDQLIAALWTLQAGVD